MNAQKVIAVVPAMRVTVKTFVITTTHAPALIMKRGTFASTFTKWQVPCSGISRIQKWCLISFYLHSAVILRVLATDNFQSEQSMVEDFIKNRGHHCLFLPKFHCELNAIERVWGEAKRYTRSYCNYTIGGLRKSLPNALDVVRSY